MMGDKTFTRAIAMATVLLAASPALADVKAGVDAWTRGDYPSAVREWQDPAAKGDPRAQYLLGIAHFNGDGVPKDWVRAYALVSLARQAGLGQANGALAQMDQHIPLEQRQEAAALASELASQADATRARQLAAADLGAQMPGGPFPASPVPARPSIASAETAVADAVRVAGSDSPRTAGADYARPKDPQPAASAIVRPALAAPAPAKPPASTKPTPPSQPVPARPAGGGAWRVQLGAFGVAGNADSLWNRVRNRPELAGHGKLLVPAGRVTKLQAGGFASQAAAEAACTKLSAAGFTCLPTRN